MYNSLKVSNVYFLNNIICRTYTNDKYDQTNVYESFHFLKKTTGKIKATVNKPPRGYNFLSNAVEERPTRQ